MEDRDENRRAARLLLRSAIRQALDEKDALDEEDLATRLLAAIESRRLKPALAELAKDE